MDAGFPRYTHSAKQGNLGISIVSRIVDEEFGWLFRRIHQEHDFGIDGQIEIVTEHGLLTGQMLGCQIKNGPSFFRETNRWGYVYRGETKHFNYLANYQLPVIIIICDPETREGFWIRFRANDAQITEAGWKLTIPFGNKLSSSKASLEVLLPAVSDCLSSQKEYWRLNNLLFEHNYIMFVVGIQEVKAKDVTRAAEFRRRLTSTRELAIHCQGKINISFDGYDDDPRELFEIDEVKEYVVLLDKTLPELFFFAHAEDRRSTIMFFIFCLVGVGWEGERSAPGNPQKVIVDFGQLGPFLEYHFTYLNYILEWLELPDEENKRICKKIAKLMGMPESEMKHM